MNPIINQIFEQALDRVVPHTRTVVNHDQLLSIRDEFAELIVKECADIMDGRDENGNAKDGQYLLTQFGIDASQRYT